MFEELWPVIITGEQDIGVRLVVAQDDIVARLEQLDQIGLKQQRLSLGMGADDLDRGSFRNHAGDAYRLADRVGIGGDALA